MGKVYCEVKIMSTTSDLALLRRKLAAADYSPDAYVKEIATRCVGGHELHLQRKNIQVSNQSMLLKLEASHIHMYLFWPKLKRDVVGCQ